MIDRHDIRIPTTLPSMSAKDIKPIKRLAKQLRAIYPSQNVFDLRPYGIEAFLRLRGRTTPTTLPYQHKLWTLGESAPAVLHSMKGLAGRGDEMWLEEFVRGSGWSPTPDRFRTLCVVLVAASQDSSLNLSRKRDLEFSLTKISRLASTEVIDSSCLDKLASNIESSRTTWAASQCDLTPPNILLRPNGQPVIIDFSKSSQVPAPRLLAELLVLLAYSQRSTNSRLERPISDLYCEHAMEAADGLGLRDGSQILEVSTWVRVLLLEYLAQWLAGSPPKLRRHEPLINKPRYSIPIEFAAEQASLIMKDFSRQDLGWIELAGKADVLFQGVQEFRYSL